MNRAALGRADLIHWAAALDDARLERLAARLGYAREDEPAPEGGTHGAAPIEGARATDPATATVGPPRRRHHALTERCRLAPPTDAPATAPAAPPEAPVALLGLPPPLIPWPRLWPFLHAALGEEAARRQVDLPRLVRACARVRPPRRLPRLKGRRWAGRAQVILDLSPRLYPFWDDFHALVEALPRLRGAWGLQVLRLDQGPDGPVQRLGPDGWGPPGPYPDPGPGTPVLILGDLGFLGTPLQRTAWVRFARRRLAAGGRPPVALTPVPPRWWDPALAGLCFPVALDRAAPLPPRPAGPRPWPARAPDLETALRDDPGAARLLTLLAPCIAIGPALLRHLRHRLPAGLADAGSEAAAWQSPSLAPAAFAPAAFALVPGDPRALADLRRAHADQPEAWRRFAWDLIRAQQAGGAPRSNRIEERLLHAALNGGADPEAEAYLSGVGALLDQTADPATAERARLLAAWVGRVAARLHPEVWNLSPAVTALWLKANPQAAAGGVALPPGYPLHRALAAGKVPPSPGDWRLVQRGAALVVEPWPAAVADLQCGSPLAERLRAERAVVQVGGAGSGAPGTGLPLAPGAALALGEGALTLDTGQEELCIAPLERPAWAHTLGRDRDGLFVGFDDGQGERRAYWYCPGGLHADPALRHWPEGRPATGCFMDEAQYRALCAGRLWPEELRGRITGDDLGLRAELTIAGEVQGFRWVWPGRFLMGSPATEAGRDDDEMQHEVTLTRGFWLAETACTQALWEAVMGDNPSYAEGPRRPVETISFEDVWRFLARVNGRTDRVGRPAGGAPSPDPGGQGADPWALRLPTEAEWEYACRAGTPWAYSFGDEFDPTLANDGGATVDVRSLPPNPWGFYEMHGNVWEWCQDWFGAYPPGPVVDPRGAESGGGRVLRGGGWFRHPVNARSAYRRHDAPGFRARLAGFRLALARRGGSSRSMDQGPIQSCRPAGEKHRAGGVSVGGAAARRRLADRPPSFPRSGVGR